MTASLPPAGTVVRLTRQTEWGEEVLYREVEVGLSRMVLRLDDMAWTADDLTRHGWSWEPVRPAWTMQPGAVGRDADGTVWVRSDEDKWHATLPPYGRWACTYDEVAPLVELRSVTSWAEHGEEDCDECCGVCRDSWPCAPVRLARVVLALAEPTEEAVEAPAWATWLGTFRTASIGKAVWEQATEDYRALWHRQTRAILAAALTAAEEA